MHVVPLHAAMVMSAFLQMAGGLPFEIMLSASGPGKISYNKVQETHDRQMNPECPQCWYTRVKDSSLRCSASGHPGKISLTTVRETHDRQLNHEPQCWYMRVQDSAVSC